MVSTEVRLQCRDTELTPHKMKMVAPAILHKVMQSSEIRQCMGEIRKILSVVTQVGKNTDPSYFTTLLFPTFLNITVVASSGIYHGL